MKHGEHIDRKTAKLLLDAGANYDMLSAIWLADSNRVCAMLKNNPKEALGEGVLATAAAYGRTAIVKLLLDHKADPKDRGLGWPALYFALEFPEVVQLLLKAGADAKFRIEFTDLFNKGIGPEQTLLHCAAELGQVDTGKLLLEAGVSVDSHDAYHKTPLQWAARAGKPEMVKFFLQNKASVAGKVGRQAMAEAAQFVGNAKTRWCLICVARRAGSTTLELTTHDPPGRLPWQGCAVANDCFGCVGAAYAPASRSYS